MGGDRDPQVRSTLEVQRREGSLGEEHSQSVLAQSRESDRLRAGRQKARGRGEGSSCEEHSRSVLVL
ncbi:hypothetical protein Tco_0440899, partial [Tanacetum coccineum]